MATSSENSDAKYMDRHQKVGSRAADLGGDPIERDFALNGQQIYTKPTGGTGTPASQISRHGITWSFSQEYESGTYVCGDPWVVGPVSISGITPATVNSGGRVMHGSTKNMQPGWATLHGFDSSTYFDFNTKYSDSVNAAIGVSSSSPLILQPGDSLISVESQLDIEAPGAVSIGGPAIFKTAAVLTVVSEAPPAGSFRPPWCSAGDSPYNTSSINMAKLVQKFPTSSSTSNFAVSQYAQAIIDGRIHLDWINYWLSRATHPADNMPNYGRDIQNLMSEMHLYMLSTDSTANKLPLLYGLLQVGIDWDGLYTAGMSWPADGGHMEGRKWPIMFKRAMFNEATALGDTNTRFQENDQTHYVQETSPGVYNFGYGGYTAAMVGMPEWAFRHYSAGPQGSENFSSFTADAYRVCCTARVWPATALCVYEMGLRDDWGHDAFFDYLDRYSQSSGGAMGFGWNTSAIGGPFFSMTWPVEMWNTYRSTYTSYPMVELEAAWPQG